MKIKPYLFFEGRADEAIAFYREALGAEVLMLMRFKESPEPSPPGAMPPGSEDKVMHATLRIGEVELLLSDGHCSGQPTFQGVSLALQAQTQPKLDAASTHWPRAAKCGCHSARPSSRPPSAWSPTASGSAGW